MSNPRNEEYVKFVSPAQLEITRWLPASCERVWEYLTDPELRQQWFCAGATGDRPGTEFVMDFDHSRISSSPPPEGIECGDPIVMTGTIVTFEPPHKLVYLWPGEIEEDDSVVSIELTQEGQQTRIQLIHSKVEKEEFRKGASAGWHTHLDLLIDLLEGRTARDFWLHFGKIKLQYDQKFAESVS